LKANCNLPVLEKLVVCSPEGFLSQDNGMDCLHFLHETERLVVDRLLDWHDQAKLAGRKSRADALLLLAWAAYDRPPKISKAAAQPVEREINTNHELPDSSEVPELSQSAIQ
jgi:hypothetical protein